MKKKSEIKKVRKTKRAKVVEVKQKFLNTAADVVVSAVVICVVAVVIGLSYTGLRAATGMDKAKETAETPAVTEAATVVPTAIPVKAYVIPEKYKHLFKDVKTKEEIQKIHIEEAKVLFESGKALFIDARSEQEYKQSHVPGSIFISAGAPPERIAELKEELKGKILVPYCHGAGCHLSDKVAYNLYAAGYKKVLIFFGGWPEWTAAGMPVQNYEPPAQYKRLFEEAQKPEEVIDITLDEAKFLYDNMLANIIDVDYPDKYNEIRIDRALSLPIDKLDELMPNYASYFSQKPVIVYCHGMGGKSKTAVEKMHKAGYKKVLRFVQALPQWEKAGYPVYKAAKK